MLFFSLSWPYPHPKGQKINLKFCHLLSTEHATFKYFYTKLVSKFTFLYIFLAKLQEIFSFQRKKLPRSHCLYNLLQHLRISMQSFTCSYFPVNMRYLCWPHIFIYLYNCFRERKWKFPQKSLYSIKENYHMHVLEC